MQELKGNIRVFCRLRPLLREEADNEAFKIKTSVKSLELLNEADDKKGTNYRFEFDRVFGSHSTQGEVFEEISQLVQSR